MTQSQPNQYEDKELREELFDAINDNVQPLVDEGQPYLHNVGDAVDTLLQLITQKQLEATKQGWADGWYARHQAEDYSALIGKLKALKPQNGAFFLLGEIERVIAELKKGLQ